MVKGEISPFIVWQAGEYAILAQIKQRTFLDGKSAALFVAYYILTVADLFSGVVFILRALCHHLYLCIMYIGEALSRYSYQRNISFFLHGVT